jgi:hypothetical protein
MLVHIGPVNVSVVEFVLVKTSMLTLWYPRFAIVVVIGKIWVAAVALLPKKAWIGPTPPPVVVVAFVVAVVVIVDRILFDTVCSLSQFTFTICWDSKYISAAKNTPAITASISLSVLKQNQSRNLLSHQNQ